MEEKKPGGLGEQQAKRRRINRIKMSIITGLLIWIVVLTVLLITLLVKVIFLEQRLNNELISREEFIQEHGEKSADPPKERSSDIVLKNDDSTVDVSEDNALGENGASKEDISKEDISETDSSKDQTQIPDKQTIQAVPEKGQAAEDNFLEEGEHPKVYLTFDDGPSENTAKILDILKERNIKATFFVIGQEDEESKALYRRIVAEGHTLGMHSFSHKYDVIYKSLDAFKEDMEHLQSYLKEVTGVAPTIMRFPGGSSNMVSNVDIKELIRYVKEQGITYYDWNVVSGDATSQVYTPDELVENVMNDVVKYNTSVVLMHDASAKASTVDALVPMIDQLQALGAELLPIDEDTKPIQHIKAEDVD